MVDDRKNGQFFLNLLIRQVFYSYRIIIPNYSQKMLSSGFSRPFHTVTFFAGGTGCITMRERNAVNSPVF